MFFFCVRCLSFHLEFTMRKTREMLYVSVNYVRFNVRFVWLLADEEDQKKNSSLLAHIVNLPGFDASTARFATQYSTRCSPEKSVMEIVPTAAELMLPWRRDQSYPNQHGGGTLRFPFTFVACWFCFQRNRISISSCCQMMFIHRHTTHHSHKSNLIARHLHFGSLFPIRFNLISIRTCKLLIAKIDWGPSFLDMLHTWNR